MFQNAKWVKVKEPSLIPCPNVSGIPEGLFWGRGLKGGEGIEPISDGVGACEGCLLGELGGGHLSAPAEQDLGAEVWLWGGVPSGL